MWKNSLTVNRNWKLCKVNTRETAALLWCCMDGAEWEKTTLISEFIKDKNALFLLGQRRIRKHRTAMRLRRKPLNL